MKLKEMTQLFACIKSKRDDIKVIKEEIRKDFEKIVINFFKDKGINFKLVNNKYDPINRYYLDTPSDNFTYREFTLHGSDKPERQYNTPKFAIVPWEFVIKFEWHKAKNQNITRVYWHPEEMSLEDLYNKKLKKVFDLI